MKALSHEEQLSKLVADLGQASSELGQDDPKVRELGAKIAHAVGYIPPHSRFERKDQDNDENS